MIAAIEAMFGLSTLWARIAATGGFVAIIISLWAGFAYHYQKKGEARVLARIEQASETNAQKASAARRSVERIPADQLADRYRRD